MASRHVRRGVPGAARFGAILTVCAGGSLPGEPV